MASLSRKILTLREKRRGFTLIEVMIVVSILTVLLLIAIWAYRLQMLKGRDARRKADLAAWQKLMEDYVNDSICYPEGLICGAPKELEGYISFIPCDPLNNVQHHYLYTYDERTEGLEACNKWFKVYSRLENENDPAIAEKGCTGGCGPENYYNYWVGSANVTEVAKLPNEFWPDVPGEPPGNGGPPPENGEPPPENGEPPPENGEPPPENGNGNGEPPAQIEPSCNTQCGKGCLFPYVACNSCCEGGYSYKCDPGDLADPCDDICIYDPECTEQ